jgi:ubiquinone/menaquinone biosynthesis C-methylase UbiE
MGLLRLRGVADASVAEEILSEIRSLIDRLDTAENRMELQFPMLDVAKGYARWAEVYDSADNAVIDLEGPAVHAVLADLGGAPVLDAACGTGRHLAWLIDEGREVIGVDQSSAMLDRARAKAPAADLRLGDICNLPLVDESVAGVVCGLALEHVEDLAGAFREFRRVLVPSGWAVVSVLHPVIRNIFGWGAWFVDETGRADVVSYRREVSDYLNAAQSVGLKLVEAREVTITDDVAERAAPPSSKVGGRIGLRGLPLILVLRLSAP